MSDLQDALDAIRGRARDAERGRSDDYVKWSQSDVPRLLATVEAVAEKAAYMTRYAESADYWGGVRSAADEILSTLTDHLESP